MEITARQLFQENRQDEIWDHYCNFLELSTEEAMQIQYRLLEEQLDLLKKSKLGRELLKDMASDSIEEFRRKVPLTTYKDYAPSLLEKNEDVLPEEPYYWVHTSGRSGEYRHKWVPYTKRFWERAGRYVIASLIFGSASKKGEVILEPGDTIFFTLAPRPYMSGALMVDSVLHHFPFKFLPPPEIAEEMDYFERIEKGLQMSLTEGIDVFYGIASILLSIAKHFEEGTSDRKKNLASLLMSPRALSRLVKGMFISRKNKRGLLPKDLWSPKVLAMGGMDCDIFRDKVIHYWGGNPIEGYASTEAGVTAVQTWNRKGNVLIPDQNFLEFIPFDEHLKSKENPAHQPVTVTMDQLQENEIYEIVITNFLGGPFVRYRIGDLVEVTAKEDPDIGVRLPHIKFYSRADDLIDLAGFTRLTELTIWRAIENSGISYNDWVVKKETEQEAPVLNIYLDAANHQNKEQVEEKIHRKLAELDSDYADAEKMLGLKPVRVTFLPEGAFQKYIQKKRDEGVDLARLKPYRMNPSNDIIKTLSE